MSDIIKFKKIPLRDLIDNLVLLYHTGADYIDIIGKSGRVQDEIGLAVMQDYFISEKNMEEEPVLKESEIRKITDDDINEWLG